MEINLFAPPAYVDAWHDVRRRSMHIVDKSADGFATDSMPGIGEGIITYRYLLEDPGSAHGIVHDQLLQRLWCPFLFGLATDCQIPRCAVHSRSALGCGRGPSELAYSTFEGRGSGGKATIIYSFIRPMADIQSTKYLG